MKVFALGVLAALASLGAADDDCPESQQIKCTDDVRAAYEPCKKAAESGGSDMAADLNCLKYWNKMKPDCWPCICLVAHDMEFHIKGCD